MKRLFVLLVMISLFVFPIECYAKGDANTEAGVLESGGGKATTEKNTKDTTKEKVEYGVYFKADYSDNIKPKKGDKFEIEYYLQTVEVLQEKEEPVIQTLEFDASEMTGDGKMMMFPRKSAYTVVSIRYTGKNGGIFSYKCLDVFNARGKGKEDDFVIYIGINNVSEYPSDEYEHYIVKGTILPKMVSEMKNPDYEKLKAFYEECEKDRLSKKDREKKWTEFKKKEYEYKDEENVSEENKTEVTEETEETEEDVYEEDYGDDYGVEVQTPGDDTPSIEVYSTETTTEIQRTEKKETSKIKSIIMVVVAFVLMVLIIAVVVFLMGNRKYRR